MQAGIHLIPWFLARPADELEILLVETGSRGGEIGWREIIGSFETCVWTAVSGNR
jgi:hypothetical protein